MGQFDKSLRTQYSVDLSDSKSTSADFVRVRKEKEFFGNAAP